MRRACGEVDQERGSVSTIDPSVAVSIIPSARPRGRERRMDAARALPQPQARQRERHTASCGLMTRLGPLHDHD